ncbi:MAG: alpha-1,2-fucosyltransferase, partial [Gemmiger sp.]
LPVHWMDGHRTAAQDLALMRRCRAFIMSNSTFSWWGQWLAQDKTVFAPDRWYTNGKKTALYQENWNLIPTE